MRSNSSRRGGALRLLLIVVVVLVLLGAAALFFVDSAAAKAIETGGTYALGVPTRVESTSIGLFSGKFGISGLEVDNPKGYDVPRFLKLDGAGTEVGFSKLLGDTIEIERVEIRGVEIDLERKDGKTNYDVILANLQKLSGDSKPAAESGSSKQLVIKKLVLSDVKARLGLLPLVPATTISLPNLELDNVGTADKAATIAQVFERLVAELLASAVKNGGNLIPDDVGKALKQGLAGLKGLGNLGLEGLEGAGKVLEGGAKELGEGIKGLFGK
ncbi:MAG: hypothetical protein EPO68_05855 [Planctomycetota bacterium]|nr:MAG: hypothetical protein EPO68_05855 [Planctomycetota bacterium]